MSAPESAPGFDHHSPAYARDWRRINADLRAHCPVAHTDAHGGFHVVTRYEDVAAIARDDVRFSSYQERPDGTRDGATIPPGDFRQVPIEMDPPEFFAYRRLLTPWFSPGAAEQWQPYLREVTTFCLDRVIESGRADLVADIAAPVPAILTLRLLGLPTEEWPTFSSAVHAMIHSAPGSPEHGQATTGITAMIGELARTLAARRAEPRDDFLSHLVQAKVDGEPIDDERVMQIVTLIIFGGVDTTTALIGHALEWLGRHPAERTRLRGNPDLLPAATEEFLRYFSPVQALSRTTTTEWAVGGKTIGAGERLLLSWASANFDESVFDRPDDLILDRFPNRHQAFGLGIHRCLGSNLARSEFRIVLEETLRRLPDYEIDAQQARPYDSIGIVNGWVTLPATFTAGVPEGPGALT